MNKETCSIRYFFEDQNYRIKVLCFGELGKIFSDSFSEKLPGNFILQFVEDSGELQQQEMTSVSKNEMLMLITEYEPDIWKMHLENDQIRKNLENVELSFIVIHPKNGIVPVEEQRLLQLMGGKENYYKLILAMPDMNRKKALETMCWTIYDIIASTTKIGYVNLDYTDLLYPGHHYNWYGTVYEGECRNCRQLQQLTKDICAQITKDMLTEEILSALMIITSRHNETILNIANVVGEIEKILSENTTLTWGHILTESECAITLVLFREMEEEFA